MSQFKERLTALFPAEAELIRQRAYQVHDAVNQTYDCRHPYGFHLDMVAETVAAYADSMNVPDEDILSLWFGAYFHDSIEDARLTYNDVVKVASEFLPADKAVQAAEIVFALTNEKGRTRAERANHRYYEGIRSTPYAPFVKLADRFSNISYSHSPDKRTSRSKQMADTYRSEMSHFIDSITSTSGKDDIRFSLPTDLLNALSQLLIQP